MLDEPVPGDADGPAPDAPRSPLISRKNLLRAAVAAIPIPILAGAVPALGHPRSRSDAPLAPTPQCDDGDETPSQIEGPYFKPSSPLRTSLREAGIGGTLLTVSGYVFGRTCQPLPGVLLDFWQADADGDYDMSGFRLRGHQFTDGQGGYTLQTIVAGLYPGRTRHLHVKVQAPNQPVLTTQLYFPNEPRNNTDSLFDPRLLMTVRTSGGEQQGTFDVVLDVAGGGPTTGPSSSPTTAPGDAWVEGHAYQVGDVATYGGLRYRCRQAHTAYAGWEPPRVPALWQQL